MHKFTEGINVLVVVTQILVAFITLVSLYVTIEPSMFGLPVLTIPVEVVLLLLLIGLSSLVRRKERQLLASLRITWAVTIVTCVLIVLDVIHLRALIGR